MSVATETLFLALEKWQACVRAENRGMMSASGRAMAATDLAWSDVGAVMANMGTRRIAKLLYGLHEEVKDLRVREAQR